MDPLTVALPKGRMLDPAQEIFRQLGCLDTTLSESARKLVHDDGSKRWRYILAKAGDVPVYVEYGAADIGVVGLDVLQEMGSDVYAPLPLGFGKCRMVVAAPRSRAQINLRLAPNLRVGSKYPRITKEHFRKQGISVEIIPLSGSVELAPAVGLSDLLVDIVQTGTTLRENDLVVLEEVMASEAYLIVNRASYVLKNDQVRWLIESLSSMTHANQRERNHT